MRVDRFFGESRGVSEWTHARVPKDASRGVGLSNEGAFRRRFFGRSSKLVLINSRAGLSQKNELVNQ
jgi:hypothetical protein